VFPFRGCRLPLVHAQTVAAYILPTFVLLMVVGQARSLSVMFLHGRNRRVLVIFVCSKMQRGLGIFAFRVFCLEHGDDVNISVELIAA
jgi:hypothetical protein